MDVCSEGGQGEICFGGVMSSGYWQRPDLTAMNFVQHPELGLLYRTGDLGKWQRSQLVVLGRIDRQVKIRGCRVELLELELTLRQLVLIVAVLNVLPWQHREVITYRLWPSFAQIPKILTNLTWRS